MNIQFSLSSLKRLQPIDVTCAQPPDVASHIRICLHTSAICLSHFRKFHIIYLFLVIITWEATTTTEWKKVVRFVRREETNIRNFWIKWNGRIHSTHTPWEKDGLENKIERHIHSMPALPWTNKYLFRLCRNPNRRMFRTNLFVQLLCDEESTKKKPQTIS